MRVVFGSCVYVYVLWVRRNVSLCVWVQMSEYVCLQVLCFCFSICLCVWNSMSLWMGYCHRIEIHVVCSHAFLTWYVGMCVYVCENECVCVGEPCVDSKLSEAVNSTQECLPLVSG